MWIVLTKCASFVLLNNKAGINASVLYKEIHDSEICRNSFLLAVFKEIRDLIKTNEPEKTENIQPRQMKA